jgi:hypothetical protein
MTGTLASLADKQPRRMVTTPSTIEIILGKSTNGRIEIEGFESPETQRCSFDSFKVKSANKLHRFKALTTVAIA